MTFEFSSEQQAIQKEAQAFSRERLPPMADVIEDTAAISHDLVRDLQAVAARAGNDAVALVIVVEELATASAAAAAASTLPPATSAGGAILSGLRGFGAPRIADTRARLVMAAVALGIGRAAVTSALENLRESARRCEDQEKPHWAVADAATELAAASMLTLQAAQTMNQDTESGGHVAMAKLAATRAAHQAVDVALRVVGPDALVKGSLLERLTRDVRAVSLIAGSEEELRALAAEAVLPR
jgi:alkylation response protein AidB-like acyl-CoA dehydrogenase